MNLELVRLRCGYGEHTVLQDVGFSLRSGEICCILGQNGVGKSTLFQTLLRLIPPLGGCVRLDGVDTGAWPRNRMARHFAYVAQSHQTVFPHLVEDMVMLGRLNHMGPFGAPGNQDREAVNRILEEMELERFRGIPYTRLSGGERQMVMIARALAQDTEILVLDEPTANLDYGNRVQVLRKLKRLAENGKCVIFTTHDPEQALLLECRTALITAHRQVVFGDAPEVVTERHLAEAYDAPIRVVELIDPDRGPIRVCLPDI